MSKYRFTLFTPCYNSENFIHRVFKSIDNFTFRDFEWIIVNDASTDNTHELISDYISKANFPVKYLNRQVNKMLTANYKYALENAEGEFFLPMGHDDEWIPETLDVFNKLFTRYESEDIACIGALCQNQDGKLVDFEYPEVFQVADFFKICFEKRRFRKEIPFCYKLNIFKEYYKGEISNTNMEIGSKYKMGFVNKVLRIYYINENITALSTRTRKDTAFDSFNNYANWVNLYQYKLKHTPLFRYRGIFAFPFQGILANIRLHDMLKLIEKKRNKFLVILFYLPAVIVSKRIS